MKFLAPTTAVIVTFLATISESRSIQNRSGVGLEGLVKRDDPDFVNAPIGGRICGVSVPQAISEQQIATAGEDASARQKDGRTVPNPKNKGKNNPYPHIFAAQPVEDLGFVAQCTQADMDNRLIYEYPIFQNGLFDENSKDVGDHRLFFKYDSGANVATFCNLGSHDFGQGKSKKFGPCAVPP